MVSNYQRLVEFHEAIDENVPSEPGVPSPRTLGLRRALIDEEHAEVAAAFDRLAADPAHDVLADFLHELADLLYVTYGTFVACGADADAVFAEVHAANMRKAAGPRRDDGKQLKPEGWRPADVRRVLFGPAKDSDLRP